MTQKVLKILMLLSLLTQTALAADIHHFEVIATPDTISAGEALDLTIKAVDKNDAVVTDYDGSILIFSESDQEATFPNALEDNSYTFRASDEGVIKFENAVTFKNVGENDIHVYDASDLTDSILGLAEITVTEKVVVRNIPIEIIYPESGVTIGGGDLTISGTATKNHQIKILVNDTEEILTTTNKEGVFEKKIKDLEEGINTFTAFILDSDNTVIGTSKEVSTNVNMSIPIFKNLILKPGIEVEVESEITAELYATEGLIKILLILDDASYELEETKAGIYTGSFLAPTIVGAYPIDIQLTDELNHSSDKKNALTLTTLEKIPELESATLTKDVCENGDYSGGVFDGECGIKPVDFNAPIDLGIKNLRVVTLKTKSILTWDPLSDAVEYQVFKKVASGDFEKFQTVTEPKVEIMITGDEIRYDYFAIKAIGKKLMVDTENDQETVEKEIEGDLSDAIKIPTGPKEMILIILSLLLGFGLIIFKQKFRPARK